MLTALFAELFEFNAFLQDFLVFLGAVVQRLACCALHFDEIVLGHTWKSVGKCWQKCTGKGELCQTLAKKRKRPHKWRSIPGATVGG